MKSTAEVAGAARRMTLALGRRLAEDDPGALVYLARLRLALAEAEETAVDGMRDTGFTDADIAAELGVTRQAVRQRWPHKVQRAGGARVWR